MHIDQKLESFDEYLRCNQRKERFYKKIYDPNKKYALEDHESQYASENCSNKFAFTWNIDPVNFCFMSSLSSFKL